MLRPKWAQELNLDLVWKQSRLIYLVAELNLVALIFHPFPFALANGQAGKNFHIYPALAALSWERDLSNYLVENHKVGAVVIEECKAV